MKFYQVIFVALVAKGFVFAQNKVDVRLDQISADQSKSCYSIDLRSPYGESIDLAGQNYRIFYDAKKAKLLKESINSKLSLESYSKVDIINTTQNDIGFLSLSIDGRSKNTSTITLDHKGSWTPVQSVCFEHINHKDFDLIWADKSTEDFASAQVALSEWIDHDNQKVLQTNLLINHMANNEMDQEGDIEMTVFPNPIVDYVQVDIKRINEKVDLIIKDVIGREVVFESIIGQSNMIYDLSNWPSGRYTIELLGSNGNIVHQESIVKADSAH